MFYVLYSFCYQKVIIGFNNSCLNSDRLLKEVREGIDAELMICKYNDWIVCNMHEAPLGDAVLGKRDRGCETLNPEHIHPSSVDLITNSHVLGDGEEGKADIIALKTYLLCHKHQNYCDENRKKRNKARADLEKNGPDKVKVHPDNIPHKCRFNFPQPITSKSFLKVTQYVVNKGLPNQKVRTLLCSYMYVIVM